MKISNTRSRTLLQIALLLAVNQNIQAQVPVNLVENLVCCPGECAADIQDQGGHQHAVDLGQHKARARARGGIGSRSAFAEVGVSFEPCFTAPATISVGSFITGNLRGCNNSRTGSVRLIMMLRDLTNNVLLDSVAVFEREENGPALGCTVAGVGGFFDQPETAVFTTTLVAGNVYGIVMRLEVRKSGGIAYSNFYTGNRGADFDCILIEPQLVDTDRDGLYDVWEEQGIDLDCDGNPEVDLPAMGAQVNHKDIFVEVDWMQGFEPSKATFASVQEAFASAPINAGGMENPDGEAGINLWIDAGNLHDPTANESGVGASNCNDGLDNDGDGNIDQDDSGCLVGSPQFAGDLGRGNALPVSFIPDLSGDSDGNGSIDFYEVKQDNFDELRSSIFHYVIHAQKVGTLGGQAECGGNDMILYQLDPSTFPRIARGGLFMHELGHNLGLGHGGDNDVNNKPNYVSVMNYDFAFGIPRNNVVNSQDLDLDGISDDYILDYSPPRFPGGRGTAPLPAISFDPNIPGVIDETLLDERREYDPVDPENRFAFRDQNGSARTLPLDTPPDYNGDSTNDALIAPIDLNGDGELNGDSGDEPLEGFHDWNNIQLDFKSIGPDSFEEPVSTGDCANEPTADELLGYFTDLRTTDLVITKTDDIDMIAAGQDFSYTITVTNNGPNKAANVEVFDVLPKDLVFEGSSGDCSIDQNNTLRCIIRELNVGESEQFIIDVHILAGANCDKDQFKYLNNYASVINRWAPDPSPGNTSDREETRVLCIPFEYPAKIVCGTQNDSTDHRLVQGEYASTINIHNPNDEKVYFFKKLALAYPPEGQRPGQIIPIAIDSLEYDESLKFDCNEIAGDLLAENEYIEGFLVIQSPRRLDVTGVYSGASLSRYHESRDISVDIEQIQGQRSRTSTRELPDLVPRAPFGEPPTSLPNWLPQGYCIASDNGFPFPMIEIIVKNLGNAMAAASTTEIVFGLPPNNFSENTTIDVPQLGPEQEFSFQIQPPTGCYSLAHEGIKGCPFRIIVDLQNQVLESDETNNEDFSICPQEN